MVSECTVVLWNVLLRGSYHWSMKNLLARLAMKFIDLQCRREYVFNVAFDLLTNIFTALMKNLHLDFNSVRKVLNFLVFACGTFNRGCTFDVMPYDLVLTYKLYAATCCLLLQGANVNQIAENSSLFSVFLLSSNSILLNNTLWVSLFPFKGILYYLSFLSVCCLFVHSPFFCYSLLFTTLRFHL